MISAETLWRFITVICHWISLDLNLGANSSRVMKWRNPLRVSLRVGYNPLEFPALLPDVHSGVKRRHHELLAISRLDVHRDHRDCAATYKIIGFVVTAKLFSQQSVFTFKSTRIFGRGSPGWLGVAWHRWRYRRLIRSIAFGVQRWYRPLSCHFRRSLRGYVRWHPEQLGPNDGTIRIEC